MSDSSRLEKTFSEFDSNNTTKSEATDNLLYPEHEDYEYRRIRNAVICHGKLSKEDASAILLQKTFRMYKVHRLFANYYRQFQHVKKVTMRPYFIAFVLNSHAGSCDRRKLYETQFSRALFCKKLFKGYTHPPFEVYTVTDQCLLPPYIDSSVLSQFVKKFYHTLILRAFLEWRIIARKQITERKCRENKNIDVIKRKIFGNEYVCFSLWYRYVKRKNKKKMNDGAKIPQWDYYMNLKDQKNAKYQKSLNIRKTTIKKASIQALLNRVIEKREEENVLNEADKFRVKRNMIFALSAWAHYIVIQHNRVNTMRAILREWFRFIQQRIHFRELLKKFQPRHSYFSKRAVFSMFMKNRRISQITSLYLYCKIQTKPSLALFFLAVLTHDDDVAPFYLAMHAWISLYRRRKKWQHFVFQDIKSSNYDAARRKALIVLRKQETAASFFTSNFTSSHFQQETLDLYEYVMKMKTEYETIFLLSSDEEAKEAVANSNSPVEQRELFFKMWMGMKPEPSLIMRLSAINMQKRRTEKANEAMKQSERTLKTYQKAVTFLESYNLASDEKFKILKETIIENNKKALANRTRCIHRDKMIIYAHCSHYDAETLKTMKPLFKSNDILTIVSKVKEATNQLTRSFEKLINIASLGRSLNQPNTFSFSQLNGCQAPIQPFNIDHKTIQSKFITKIKKGQISPITQIQFERLMANSSNENAYKNLKTYQRVDPYQNPLIDSKPPLITGVNRRLLQAFPLKGRKPIKFDQTAKKKLNFNVINSQKEIAEEEEDFDDFDDIGLGNFRRPGIINAYDKSKGSMFFNSIKSFANIISQSSFSIFGTSSSSVGMDISNIQVPIEEVDEFDDSDSNSGRSGGCSERLKLENNSILVENSLISSNSSKQKLHFTVDDYDEEQNESDTLIDLKDTHFETKEEIKQEKKNVTFRGLNDGFDDELMKSINKSNPPKSPDASRKTKLFIEILFGRASRNQISIPMMNLKKRLIQELKNQKEGLPIPGILTQETVMPIANLLDLYHQDRDKQLIESTSLESNTDLNNNDENNSSRSVKNDLYSVNYQSKKYRSIKTTNDLFGSSDEYDEENKQKEQANDENESVEESEKDRDSINSRDSTKSIKEGNEFESEKNNTENNIESNSEYEYEYEYDENGEVDENGKKLKKRRKKTINKESSRSKNSKEKGNKESSRNKKEKNKSSDEKTSKKGSSQNKSKNKSEVSHKKSKSNKEQNYQSKKRRKKIKKDGQDENEYEYENENENEKENEIKNDQSDEKDSEYEYSNTENNQHIRSFSSSSSSIMDSSREKHDQINKLNEEEEEKTENSQMKQSESNETIDKKSTTSSQNSRTSTASSIKSRKSNHFTPFSLMEENNSDQNPLSNYHKLFFNYLQKNLEEEEQLDLVDLDGDEELQRSRKEMLMNKNVQNRRRLWKPTKFNNYLNSHHRNPLIKPGNLLNKSQPIVIKEEKIITPSMRQAMKEENAISKVIYNNGKTIIKPTKNISQTSQSKPILKFSQFSSSSSLRDLDITKLGDNIKLDKSIQLKKPNNNNNNKNQVVTFGGGGRGISEEALNLKMIRNLRYKQLLKRREARLKEKQNNEFINEYSNINKVKSKKAKEYEDLSSYFSDLRSIVTQLIQMMASSQDDSKEFEILRKRAKFLRKKPSFVGLVVPDKLTPNQFYKKIQKIYMKYMRKKNAQATANELFQVMKNNLEFAPMIIRIIEKTASEERRYIDSKLQNSRLGKQPAEQDSFVHFIDLDWMTAIPDYKSVAVQYKIGFDKPKNLDAIVAPTQEDDKNGKINRFTDIRNKRRRKEFIFADPSKTNWDRTLEKFELQDLIMISNWVPEQLMDEVIADHSKNRKKELTTPENN